MSSTEEAAKTAECEQQKQQQQQQQQQAAKPVKELTPEELEKKKRKEEAKKAAKAAKEAKFAAKKAAQAAKAAAAAENPGKNKKKAKNSGEEKLEEKPFVNTVPKGEKKPVDGEMAPAYKPMPVEAAWYEWWEKEGFFRPEHARGTAEEQAKKGTFTIVIPPPNVTGTLHIGHALTNSIQDTLVRWHRMRGERTLWVPGMDHAGISCQVVVEKKLMKEQGLTRHDLGRDKFVEKVWEWKREYGGTIVNQLRRLGSSVDWSREVFTMDEVRSRAVTEAFVRLHEKGLIYRDNRLVNWCCTLRTAISDIEVDYIDLDGPTRMRVPGHDKTYPFGELVPFAYKVADPDTPDEEVVCATTRIETMLADTAVAIHPEDPRYKHLHGKFVVNPFNGRRIPIICDPVLVDMSFGTGCVKVTPAHDPNDYECGLRNHLEMINMFEVDGTLTKDCGEFAGMKRFDARLAIIDALKKKGLFRGTSPNPMRIGVCSRSKDIIEPRLVPQWYVNCKDAAARGMAAVRSGELRIIPKVFEADWFRWLENIRDWCVSRQLWWGHRIPAYLCTVRGRPAPNAMDNNAWVCGRTRDEALANAVKKYGVPAEDITLEQDPDVLDTWFSSGLFPFSVFGWPEQTADLAQYFPGTLLETGHDILFFWVARMVMMSLMLTDKLPFRDVFLHGMVRDAYGRKISKSLGNVVDPVDVIEGITLQALNEKLLHGNLSANEIEKAKAGQMKEYPNGIAECGTDALRFALCAYTAQGRDVNLDVNRIVGYRNFCNKVWNAVRFAFTKFGAGFTPAMSDRASLLPEHASQVDRWILSRLHNAITQTNACLTAYDLAGASTAVYNFWLYELCDVYFEATKPLFMPENAANAAAIAAARETLYTCIETGLRLLHPFMPFITEELWQRLPRRADTAETAVSIMLAEYPEPASVPYAGLANPDVEANMVVLMEIVHAIRHLNAPYSQTIKKNNHRPRVFLRTKSDKVRALLAKDSEYALPVSALAMYCDGPVEVLAADAATPAGCAVEVVPAADSEVMSELKGIVDVDVELAKLTKQRARAENDLRNQQKKVQEPQFEEKTPLEVRQAIFAKIAALEEELRMLQATADNLALMR